MKIVKISRIIGFIIAALFLVFFAMMLIGEEIANIKSFQLPGELIIPVILWCLCAIALVLSIWKPRLGGWLLIASGIAWFCFMIITVGFDDIWIALLFGLIFIVSGVLFLPWRKS